MMVLIVLIVTIYLIYTGMSYYNMPLEERYYHPRHDWFKPSGTMGHGLGILGTLMIFFGVTIYILRKRYNFLSHYIRLKYLLEFHIFLCVLGPILILFHTSFKFGGIVSIAFWSMVAVVLSGVIGRFIYIQIPRSIEGRALGLDEVKRLRSDLAFELSNHASMSHDTVQVISGLSQKIKLGQSSFTARIMDGIKTRKKINKILKQKQVPRSERSKIMGMIKREATLAGKIERLQTMQKIFKYWHVAHLPFALVMLIIVVIHVLVTLAFGYKWIF